jgi:hypothetical protein
MRLSKGLFVSVLLVSTFVASVLTTESSYAAQVTARSLTLVAGGTDGGSKPAGVVRHKFDFTIPSTTPIGSIKFEYCTTASVTACVTPTGLTSTTATLNAQPTGTTGFTTGVTAVSTTNGAPYISRTAVNAAGTMSVQLNTITNPTAANTTFFVRISTYSATNATGSPIDTGTVAASTATQIVLTGTILFRCNRRTHHF